MSQVEAVGPVDEAVGYVLKKAATALRAAMDNALRPLDLTVPQYSCLEVLGQRPGLSGSELARAVCLAAVWANSRADLKKRCKAIGITTRAFQRRKVHGLTLIAMALIRDRVPVG